ncbi:hypothetical protein [Gryllotalpicola koreensis]|uniref:Uncharacterized protein n=1 Tax=Gryllotalpicola koreensis TaxID=993086 RepID=A0ABP8AA38_9MICO
MTATLEKAAARTRMPLPGARMLRRTLWLIVVTGLSMLAYGTVLVGSHGGGAGDPANPSATVDAQLRPSFAMYAVLAVIALGAIVLVLRRAADEASAVRILTIAMIVVAALTVAAIIVGYVWFFAVPLDYWAQPGWHFAPFPFGSVHVTVTPTTP